MAGDGHENATTLGNYGETLRCLCSRWLLLASFAGLMRAFGTAFMRLRRCGSTGREPAPDWNLKPDYAK